MNICLVSQHYPPDTAQGGVGTQTWNKARALAALGHGVHVLSCAASPGPDLENKQASGITVHRMQAPGQEQGRDFSVYNEQTYSLGYSWSVLRHLRALEDSVRFDVIDFAEYGAEGFAYQLDRTLWNYIPVTVQLHAPLALLAEHIGWPEKDSEFYQVGTFMEGMSIKTADSLMACSANIADFTADFYQVPRDSIDVIHCGVDAEAFKSGQNNVTDGSGPTVLFVGNVAGNKGIETVFDSILQLRSKHPSIRLEIVGNSADDLLANLQTRIESERIGDNVRLHGFVDRARLPEFYRRADVFCSPAQYEGGVANVYLEAMACGCPVVASTAGGAPEAVIHDETGLLVPPNDTSAVTSAIDRIVSDSTLRQRMGVSARRRVEDYFAMDKYIQRVLSAYEKAIERSQEKQRRLRGEDEITASQYAAQA
jgi:glycosyltransferase involved in cell wall biosynthesis